MGASGNSIGANVAYKLAENSKNPQIHLVSRSQTTADPVIEKLKSLNPEGSYNFHPCACMTRRLTVRILLITAWHCGSCAVATSLYSPASKIYQLN